MNLLEHQAKALLRQQSLPVPAHRVVTDAAGAVAAVSEIAAPFWMLKAQIRAGERAGSGGVQRVDNVAATEPVAASMLGSRLVTPQTRQDGELVQSVLVEAGVTAIRERYVSLWVDAERARLLLLASAIGGSVLRELNLAERLAAREADVVQRELSIDTPPTVEGLHDVARAIGLESPDEFTRIVQSLHDLMTRCSAMLIEVNPLAELADGSLMCLDCKISLDPNAVSDDDTMSELFDLARDPAQRARSGAGYNYAGFDGNVGLVVTGAGLALATLDLLRDNGLEPANFLDLPPGAPAETVERAIQHMLRNAAPEVLLVNAVAGGFTDLNVIARGLLNCRQEFGERPLWIRFTGDGADAAFDALDRAGLSYRRADSLIDLISGIAREVKA